jgi:hypothetical protein
MLIKEHGVLDTEQVAVLLNVSRPTAHRALDALASTRLVRRQRSESGREHRWLYLPAPDSWTPSPIDAKLPRQASSFTMRQHAVNKFFTTLADHAARTNGTAGLVKWRSQRETTAWLADSAIHDQAAAGSGIWIEDTIVLRFLLNWQASPVAGPTAVYPAHSIAEFAAVPVDAILTVVDDEYRERDAFVRVAGHPLPLVFACTTASLLRENSEGPVGTIWRTASSDRRYRLIELAGRATPEM